MPSGLRKGSGEDKTGHDLAATVPTSSALISMVGTDRLCLVLIETLDDTTLPGSPGNPPMVLQHHCSPDGNRDWIFGDILNQIK